MAVETEVYEIQKAPPTLKERTKEAERLIAEFAAAMARLADGDIPSHWQSKTARALKRPPPGVLVNHLLKPRDLAYLLPKKARNGVRHVSPVKRGRPRVWDEKAYRFLLRIVAKYQEALKAKRGRNVTEEEAITSFVDERYKGVGLENLTRRDRKEEIQLLRKTMPKARKALGINKSRK